MQCCNSSQNNVEPLDLQEFFNHMYAGNVEPVTAALAKEPSLWLKKYSKMYPIHAACIFGNIQLLDALVLAIKQYDPSHVQDNLRKFLLQCEDPTGATGLFYASNDDHDEVVYYLLNLINEQELGASFGLNLIFNEKTNDCMFNLKTIPLFLVGNRNCLHAAAERGNTECLNLLIDAAKTWIKEEVQVQNLSIKNDNSAAVNHKRLVELLSLKDCDDYTALDTAIIHQKTKCIELLQAELSSVLPIVNPLLSLSKNELDALKKADYVKRKNRITAQSSRQDLQRVESIQKQYKPLHPNLYELSESMFVPSFLEAYKNSPQSIVKLESPGVYSFDFCTREFCNQLIEEAEHYLESGLPIVRPNSMNNYGLVLNELGLYDMFQQVMVKYIYPVAVQLFEKELMNSVKNEKSPIEFKSHHTFLVKYKMGEDLDLDTHADASDITVNLSLGKEFAGGNVFFTGQVKGNEDKNKSSSYFEYENVKGRAVIHLGKLMHGAKQLTSGERWNLIMWCRTYNK